MSGRNVLIGAGMLLLGGATYFGVMKGSHDRYNNFLSEINKEKMLVLPKDTVQFTPKNIAIPQTLVNQSDTIDISSALKGITKILKK